MTSPQSPRISALRRVSIHEHVVVLSSALIFLTIFWSMLVYPAAADTALALDRQQLLSQLQQDLAAMRNNMYTFWACHGPDKKYGGFHGRLLRDGTSSTPDAKGLVQQTRHVWAFSTFQQYGYLNVRNFSSTPTGCGDMLAGDSGSSSLPSSADMATSAYRFTNAHLSRPDHLFNWNVSRDGNTVIQNNIVVYGQWFVIYGLSKYALVFNDATAKDIALKCFLAIDKKWHNSQTGGYSEFKNNTFPPDLNAPSRGLLATLRDAIKAVGAFFTTLINQVSNLKTKTYFEDPNIIPRSLNVIMHGVEALTALHRVTGHPTVLARLKELVDILCSRLGRSKGLIYEEYLPSTTPEGQWQPAPQSKVNYGHNLESTWLVADTLDYLLAAKAISSAEAAKYLNVVVSIGQAALRDGYDVVNGGIYELGSPEQGATSTVKVWWIQAESMLALWKIYQHTADVAYLKMLADTSKFMRQYVNDNTYGETFWQVEADGTRVVTNDLDKDSKGNRWKASYHTGRLLVYLPDWINSA